MKTLALLLILASSTAGAYDLQGIEPGGFVEVAKAAGLECMYQKCEGALPVLDFQMSVRVDYDQAGNVMFLTASGMPHRYSQIRSALVAKYGKPKSAGVMTKQNAFGATLQSHVDMWESADSVMVLDEFAEVNELTLSIRKPEPKQANAGI